MQGELLSVNVSYTDDSLVGRGRFSTYMVVAREGMGYSGPCIYLQPGGLCINVKYGQKASRTFVGGTFCTTLRGVGICACRITSLSDIGLGTSRGKLLSFTGRVSEPVRFCAIRRLERARTRGRVRVSGFMRGAVKMKGMYRSTTLERSVKKGALLPGAGFTDIAVTVTIKLSI